MTTPVAQRGVAFELVNSGSQPIYLSSISFSLASNAQLFAQTGASNVVSLM